MIEAIREIGRFALIKNNKSIENPLDILVGNPSNRYTKNILFIKLQENDREYVYSGIELEEFEPNKLNKYLYRKGPSRGTDVTPTAMVTNPTGTFNGKILSWFEKNNNEDLLFKIKESLIKNKEKILEEIETHFTKENNIISLKINGEYLGDIKLFKNLLIDKAKENFFYMSSFSKGNDISKAENKICSVCNKNKAEVYGFVGTFKFYTVDKPGFVSGGFQQKDAWKNYPVCLECALILEEGKKHLGDFFDFNFYGIKYLLIPKFIINIDEKEKKNIFKIIDGQRNPTYRRSEVKRLTSDENEVLEIVSEIKNYLNLNFLFYSAPKGYNGAVFNILCYIEDILPSRIRALFNIKKDIDGIGIFHSHNVPIYENNKKVGEKPLEFNFGILRNFLYEPSEKKWISQNHFLEIVNEIFSNHPVSYHFVLNLIINKIRKDFANNYSTESDTLKGFMLLVYLQKLGLIKVKNEATNMNEQKSSLLQTEGVISTKVDNFFDEFMDFFNNDSKKAVFLVGILAQFLLKIQYRLKSSQPFRARLKGLKLDKKQIEKLLPEIQNKLEEYGENYYGQLEELISKYLLLAGNSWLITNDEISFYFVLGMNLSNNFKINNKNKGDENE